MKIKVNNEVLELTKEENIQELMHKLYPGKTAGKAVAIKNKVVPVGKWGETALQENDEILVITATQGG